MFALWVMLIDAGKGWLAAGCLPGDLPLVGIDPTIDRLWLAVACATAVVVGHVYPVWYGFRGGKGAATLVGVLLGLKPVALLPVLLVWLRRRDDHGFVGLATMLATAAFPAYVAVAGIDPSRALLTFGCVMLLFVCYTHRSNIERMRAGTENRAQRLWLLRADAEPRCRSARIATSRRAGAPHSGCSPCWRTASFIPASDWRSACAFRAAASGS